MDVLPLHVLKDSFGPIVNLLNENGVTFKEQETRSAEIMASCFTLDVVIDGDTWRSLATTIASFIQDESERVVFITTEDNRVIQSSGMGAQTLQDILSNATRGVTVCHSGKSIPSSFKCSTASDRRVLEKRKSTTPFSLG